MRPSFPRLGLLAGLAALSATLALPSASPAQQCGDVNASGSVTTSDALSVLRVAVGQPVDLTCSGECSEIEPRVTDLEAALATAQQQIAALQGLLAGVSRTADALVLSGANLQVVDGSGNTGGPTNGRGNVIIGYNEAAPDREHTGSHNLIVGVEQEYTSYSGIVAGERNTLAANNASVLGGKDNAVAEDYSVVVGGSANVTTGAYSTVGGGYTNEASGQNSVVSGGCESTASGTYAAVSGGRLGLASGDWSSVQGGYNNKGTSTYTSVSGGASRTASAIYNWAAGGATQPN